MYAIIGSARRSARANNTAAIGLWSSPHTALADPPFSPFSKVPSTDTAHSIYIFTMKDTLTDASESPADHRGRP